MSLRRSLLAAALALGFALPAAAQDRLVIAGRDAAFAPAITAIANAWAAQHPGVRIERLELPGGALYERIAVNARGDAYAPLRVVVPEERAPSILTRWWFWTGAAVVVAGVAVGSYFLFRDTTQEPARLSISLGE